MAGNLVQTLDNSHKDAGRYETDWNADGTKPGMYLVVLTADKKVIQTLQVVKSE